MSYTLLHLGEPRLKGKPKGPPLTEVVWDEVIFFDGCGVGPREAYPDYPTLPSISETSIFVGPSLTTGNRWNYGFDTESCNLIGFSFSDSPFQVASVEAFFGKPGLPGHALAEVAVGDKVRVQWHGYAWVDDPFHHLQYRIQTLDGSGVVINEDTVLVGPFPLHGMDIDFTHTITAAGNLRVAWVIYVSESLTYPASIGLSNFNPCRISVGTAP